MQEQSIDDHRTEEATEKACSDRAGKCDRQFDGDIPTDGDYYQRSCESSTGERQDVGCVSIPFEMSGEDCSMEQNTCSESDDETNVKHLAPTVTGTLCRGVAVRRHLGRVATAI